MYSLSPPNGATRLTVGGVVSAVVAKLPTAELAEFPAASADVAW